MQPAILEAALNGATPKSKFPNVPRSVDEIVSDAIACLTAGAAIVHTHVDEIGVSPVRATELYGLLLAPILARRPDALLYPSVGFGKTDEENLGHVELLAVQHGLKIGLIEPGSVNLGKFAYVNTPAAIRFMVGQCERLQLGPSVSIYEPGFLRHVLGYVRHGKLPRGSFLKFYMGGAPAASCCMRQG